MWHLSVTTPLKIGPRSNWGGGGGGGGSILVSKNYLRFYSGLWSFILQKLTIKQTY